MGYYLLTITPPECGEEPCRLIATCELRSTRNELVNRYCARHGGIALKRLEDSSDE